MTVVSWVIFSFWKGNKKYIMATALLANPGFQDLGCFHLSLVDDEFINHVVVCCARVVLIPEEPGSRDGDIPFYGQHLTAFHPFGRLSPIPSPFSHRLNRTTRDSYHHEAHYFIFTRHPGGYTREYINPSR
jgi:hypothetical protein